MDIEEVRDIAVAAHRHQQYGSYNYSYHLSHVVFIAKVLFGVTDDAVLKACWLHDILEDTKTTAEELLEAGVEPEVVEIVQCVTDEPGKNRKERKEKTYPKIKSNPKALIVKLADRISNVYNALATGNGGMYVMYKKEHNSFEEALYDYDSLQYSRIKGFPYKQIDDMWEVLDRMIEHGSSAWWGTSNG